ncbi:MAG: Cytochrome c [Verrucomicrobiaceae bacterium]|nr:Cytochrome c [Verrucomicrobiaceae bacterium]
MKPILLGVLWSAAGVSFAADKLASKTTYSKAYGETKNQVVVDPAKDLPRYPAVPASDAVGTWQVKKGFKLELAASEPQVRSPVAVAYDERGRMFVCEMIDYSEMRDVTPHLGRISMLEDEDGDGYYEKSTVFADNLPWPTGLICANGGVFVIATPDVYFFKDTQGTGKADVREVVYTGFGTGLKLLNVQGMANCPQWGLDNRIHIQSGPGNKGLLKCLKRPDLKELEISGHDVWFDPKTLEFGLEAGGGQFGMSFDNYGRRFVCSNSDHLQYYLYDEKYAHRNPYFTMPASRQSIAADGGAAEVYRISPDEPWRIIRTRWRIAGVVKGAVEGGGRVSGYFTGASGTTIYRGDAYGEDFLNNSFTGDAGGQLVHRKKISADGVSLIGRRPEDELKMEFAASRDTWVRVVNFANAPDGCLNIIDMYREVIEHPWSIPDEIKKYIDLNSGSDRGRIYRIVPETLTARRGTKVNLCNASTEELVKTLAHPNGWHRDTASRLLYERQDKAAVPLLEKLLQGDNSLAKIHALSVLDGLGTLSAAPVYACLQDKDAQLRKRAVLWCEKLLLNGASQVEMLGRLKPLVNDSDPGVRLQLAFTCGEFAASPAGAVSDDLADCLVSLANSEDSWIRAAVWSGSKDRTSLVFEHLDKS